MRVQDIVSCNDELRARLHARALRPSASPPPPVSRPHAGAAAASDTVKIPVDKIRALIGVGGATIKAIRLQTGAEIHVDDDGTIRISADSADSVRRAKEVVSGMFKELQVGQTYQAPVVSIKDFGCFVRVTTGKDGLVHISELAGHRVSKVEDEVKVGDMIWVKCISIDESGRARLSRKAAMKDREVGGVSDGA